MRVILAKNAGRVVRLRFADVSIAAIAAAIRFERSGLYEVLAGRIDVSLTRLARLARGLDESAARLLRPTKRRPTAPT